MHHSPIRRLQLPLGDQVVFHRKHTAHFARPHLGNLAVRGAVDHAKQHRATVLHDDVDRIAANGLHAWEAPLVPQLLQDSVHAARRISREEVIGIDSVERRPADSVVVL